ncbi:hypothetical protein V1506DRAFT_542512 [Lipomyces tetrasporus]
MPVSLSSLLHTPQPRGRRRPAEVQQSPRRSNTISFDAPAITATSPTTRLPSSTASQLHGRFGSSSHDGKGYSSALTLPEILHRLNPRYLFARRDMAQGNLQKQAAIEAGVIYGTRTYDWGTPTASVKSPTSATFTGAHVRAGASPRRRGTFRRILQVSASVLRTKPLPALPSFISRQKSELSRARTHIEVPNGYRTDLGDPSPGDHDALGISLPQSVGRSATSATLRTDISTGTRRRFSFDSSTNGSLLRKDSDGSNATKISVGPPLSVPEDTDIEYDNEQHEDIVVPFPAKVYSASELAEITAFDFSDDAYDDRYDDMLIDEVNAYDPDEAFSDSDDSDIQRPIGNPSLTPISEQTDEEGNSSPVMSSPLSSRSREVVAYVRGSRGWVVERRMRKGDWGCQDQDGEAENGAEVEEELLATERVERRAI